MSCVQNAGVFISLVIRQTVCVDSSLSKVKVKTVDWNRGTPHSQSMSDVTYINKSYISTSTFCRFPGLPTNLPELLRPPVWYHTLRVYP